MISLISRWFEDVNVSNGYQRTDYALLCLILAIGTVLRFWGLGNVGLHGDEETMAMPAMAILESGQPILPSGMYYARALINIYLMSGSVLIFGESEWAFRLPSALVGSLTGLAAFYMGRRFLPPHYNLAFVATITFLPGMIEVSQTARMYVFFVTCMIWFAACLFRWDRDQRVTSLFLALLVWLLCLHFHTLAIFAAPLFLFPGLSRTSWRQFVQGCVAFVIGAITFFSYRRWISAKYPDDAERAPSPDTDVSQTALDVLASANESLLLISVVLVAALLFVLLVKFASSANWTQIIPLLLIGSGLLAVALLQYHVGSILLVFGVVFWLRAPQLPRIWLLAPLLIAATMTIFHLAVLYESGLYPGRRLIGALVGTPSLWPTLRFLVYSPFAGVLYGLAILFALRLFIKGRRFPIHFLFFAMAIWVPLLILGFFTWNMPPRYAQGQLGYFLMCTFAGIAYIAHELKWVPSYLTSSRSMIVVLLLVSVVIIDPFAFSRSVNAGYERWPDHKGAAEFIRDLDLKPDAILVAEDVLQQTYYLGKVDYSLRPITDAIHFSVPRDGRLFDQYTGAPVIGTGEELRELLASSDGVDVYIIGSGENWVGAKRLFRTHGIAEVLESEDLEVVYDGRDQKTRVWKLKR